jgi:hypothetical protein
MPKETLKKSTAGSSNYKIVTAVFGLFFVVLAVAIVAVADRTVGPLVAAAVVSVLGIDAIVSASSNKPSLLSRIGPLP